MATRFRVSKVPDTAGKTLIDRQVEIGDVGGEIRIGRRPDVELSLPFRTVSALHARIFRQGAAWAVMDLGSANGTYLGDVRLGPRQAHPLQAGVVLRVADVRLVLEPEPTRPEQGAVAERLLLAAPRPESTATLARRLVADLFAAMGTAEAPRLVVVEGASPGAVLELRVCDRAYKIGRVVGCDLVLADDDVSREHAAVVRHWEGVTLRDLGSKNGVEMGGQRVTEERRLRDGDTLILGQTTLRFEDPEDKYLRGMHEDAAPDVLDVLAPLAVPAAAPVAVEETRPLPATGSKDDTVAPTSGPDAHPGAPAASASLGLRLATIGAALVLVGAVGLLGWLLFGT